MIEIGGRGTYEYEQPCSSQLLQLLIQNKIIFTPILKVCTNEKKVSTVGSTCQKHQNTDYSFPFLLMFLFYFRKTTVLYIIQDGSLLQWQNNDQHRIPKPAPNLYV
jgi:hypothetical protein